MTRTTVDEVRATLERLDKYDLPEGFRESPRSSTTIVDSQLLHRYSVLRDDYLKKSVDNTVVAQVVTYDGENFELPELPNIKVDEVGARQKHVQNELIQTSRTLQSNWNHLHADYARLQERKEDLRRMVEEFEKDGDRLDLDLDPEVEAPVDEEELENEQNRILALQQRKKELLAKLHRLQEENCKADLDLTETETSLSGVSYDNETIAQIEKENQNLRQKIEANQEMSSYFETMRLVTEELQGISIISVEEGALLEGVDVMLRIEILHSHQVEFGLQADKNKKDGLRVVSAKLLTPSMVKVATGCKDTRYITLPIPVLTDLVTLAEHMPRTKGLAFVIEETKSRIEMIHERASELCCLVLDECFQLEKSSSASNSYGRCDHEVVCALPEYGVKALMRMTPDCPRLSGSVYLDQISGPNLDELQNILESLRKTLHKRPVDLLRELKKALETRK